MPSRTCQFPRNPRSRCAYRALAEALESRLAPTVLFVNSLTDGPENLSDSTVTLRDAIFAANNDAAVSPGGPAGSGADEIRFSIAFITPRSIQLAQSPGQLGLRSDVTITGPGAGALTIRGTSTTRVFDVTDFTSI